MISFVDGPAASTHLDLKRAPLFLRVVIDADGTVDALDQLEDAPKPSEAIHVYVRVGAASNYHVRCSPRRLSGWHLLADYRLHDAQPADEVARDKEQWRKWALAERVRRWKHPQSTELTDEETRSVILSLRAEQRGLRVASEESGEIISGEIAAARSTRAPA